MPSFPSGCEYPFISCPEEQYVIPGTTITLIWDSSPDDDSLTKTLETAKTGSFGYTAIAGPDVNPTDGDPNAPPSITFANPGSFTLGDIRQDSYTDICYKLETNGENFRSCVAINFCEGRGEYHHSEAE